MVSEKQKTRNHKLLQRFLRQHHMCRDFCVLSHLLPLQDLEQCLTHQYIFGE